MVDLGLEDYIVGITKFCVHPTHIKKTKKIIGGTKNISFEKIKALKPNIILCNKEENTKDIVLTLEKEYEVHVSDIKNMDDVLYLLQQYGKLFHCQEKAEQISYKIQEEFHSLKSLHETNEN